MHGIPLMILERLGPPLAVGLLASQGVPCSADGFKVVKTRIRIEDCRAAVASIHAGPVVKLEYKWRGPRLIYEFEVAGNDGARWELECDGYSGRIIETEQEVASPDEPLFAARRKLGLEDAQRIALQRVPGRIVETEYEVESNGDASYEFDIHTEDGREVKLEVDAATGRIVEDAQNEFFQTGED
ncbi:MAG: peptidase [Gammaproteobacteria bacterium]|nr:peptidase [Gammaproteobacteria bacterium]